MFRNFYARVNGKRVDIMRDGGLSSALYASSILALFRFIEGMHGTIDSTIKDLLDSGWVRTTELRVGSILVWRAIPFKKDGIHENQKHVGFYIGNLEAISNSATEKCPRKHLYDFGTKREVECMFWNPKFDKLTP